MNKRLMGLPETPVVNEQETIEPHQSRV